MNNATFKFIEPFREFHSSESRWSTIAQIGLVWLSELEAKTHLKIFNSAKDGLVESAK
ncbi:hypothetical protein [Methylocucumis oryzae]|uniref:hypothetical protein n=1 Tax=Methylocucumis oryzae TaxID=1632867 RepID=UPI0012FEB1E2|nr:hypothetical protein [Methylocucumis oryzae]